MHNTKFWGKEGYLSLLKDVPKTGDLDVRVIGWEAAQVTKSDRVFPTKQSLKSLTSSEPMWASKERQTSTQISKEYTEQPEDFFWA